MGAYKHPGVEIMYLLDWSGYDDEDRLEWVPASKLNDFTSLNSGLEGEYVTVWWGNGKDATLTEQSKSYNGEIVDSEEIDECESDDDEQRPTTQEYEFIISYEDGDTEILNAKTLAFKQLQSVDSRKQVHRVAWILKKQDSDNIRADVMNLCDTTARTPGKNEQHAKQGGNGRKIAQEDDEEEFCGDNGPPGRPDHDGTELNPQRPKRNTKKPENFDPQKDGANDGARRHAGNKCRCYDWLNDITTCHA